MDKKETNTVLEVLPGIIKDIKKADKVEGRFKYTDLDSTRAAVIPLLTEKGITHTMTVIPETINFTQVAVGKTGEEIVRGVVRHMLIHENGDSLSIDYAASGQGVPGQSVGSLYTYTERHFLEKTFKISIDKEMTASIVQYGLDKDGKEAPLLSQDELSTAITSIVSTMKPGYVQADLVDATQEVLQELNKKLKTEYRAIKDIPNTHIDDLMKSIAVWKGR